VINIILYDLRMRMNGCRGYAKPGVKSSDMIWKSVTQFSLFFFFFKQYNLASLFPFFCANHGGISAMEI